MKGNVTLSFNLIRRNCREAISQVGEGQDHRFQIKVKSLQLQRQDVRKGGKFQSFQCIYFLFAFLALVLVVSFEDLRLHEVCKSLTFENWLTELPHLLHTFHGLLAAKTANDERNVEIFVRSGRFIIADLTFHIIFHFSLIEIIDEVVLFCSFHDPFQCIEQNTT